MKQKRAEFLKLKAMQSYQEAKFKRLKHIKSKRYRKILRLEREKNEEKKLTKLEKDDPVQFKEVLQEMEKKRMMERMSLKHKNTSKWSKQQVIYGKFNDKAREQVHEQLDISKKLTQRLKEFEYNDSDDEVEEKEDPNDANIKTAIKDGLLVNNPWIKMMSGVGGTTDNKDKENTKDESEYTKPKAFVNKKELEKAQDALQQSEDDESDIDPLDKTDLKDIAKNFNNDTDEEEEVEKQIEETKIETIVNMPLPEIKLKEPIKTISEEISTEKNIKPNAKNISLQTKTSAELVKKVNNDKHFMTLSDAFADDDVIEEFKQEKVN